MTNERSQELDFSMRIEAEAQRSRARRMGFDFRTEKEMSPVLAECRAGGENDARREYRELLVKAAISLGIKMTRVDLFDAATLARAAQEIVDECSILAGVPLPPPPTE